MSKYKILPRAETDLLDIGRYTERQWGIKQRNKYLNQLDKRFSWLAANPKLGKQRDDIKQGYYCYPEGMHVIFYRIKLDKIEILAILHQNMDIIRYL